MSISLVQSKILGNPDSGASLDITLDVTPIVGHKLIVAVSFWYSKTIIITDNQSPPNTYNERSSGGANYAHLFDCDVTTASGAFTITVTPNSADYITIAVHEYSGVGDFDTFNINNGVGTSATVSITAAEANELIFCAIVDKSNTSITADEDYTKQTETTNSGWTYLATQDRILAVAGADSADWTSSSISWWNMASAYKSASGGGVSSFLKNKNYASTTLAVSGIGSGDLELTVASGKGSLFPATGSFRCVLWGQASSTPLSDINREIVTATLNTDDTFNIVRAQEGTIAKSWIAGDYFALVLTAGKIDELENAINTRYQSGDSPSFSSITISASGTFSGLSTSKVVMSDANRNLVSGTNTDTDISSAVSLKHPAITLSNDAENNLLSLSTQALGLDNQTANRIFAGPTTGAVSAPSFRALVNADFPVTLSLSIAGLNLSGLTASLPVVTDASKNLASVTYATFKSSLSLAQADISGLTTGSTVTHVGLLLTGLTISNAVVTDGSKNLASLAYTGATSLRANLSLETTHSPTFAGLTVGSLSGIIKAAAGVLGIVSIGTSLSYSSSTLDAAQNISVSGSPQFINLKLTGLSGTGVRYITTDAAGNLGVGAGIFYNTTFINADLVAGILTVTHNLTVAYGVVIIINNSGKVVIPDQIDFSAASTSYFTVDLISYGALTGTWRVVFLPAGGTVTPTMSSPDYIGMEVFLDG
jgi:hypothetical protein